MTYKEKMINDNMIVKELRVNSNKLKVPMMLITSINNTNVIRRGTEIKEIAYNRYAVDFKNMNILSMYDVIVVYNKNYYYIIKNRVKLTTNVNMFTKQEFGIVLQEILNELQEYY